MYLEKNKMDQVEQKFGLFKPEKVVSRLQFWPRK